MATRDFKELSIDVLREAGCRVTRQRIAVVECLAAADRPLSAPEVFEAVDSDTLDKVSVYRALDTLLELNLVHKVPPNGAFLACSHRDCVNTHHVMSRCTECQEVKEVGVPAEVIAPLLFHMKNALSFVPDSHLVHMNGVCEGCSENLSK